MILALQIFTKVAEYGGLGCNITAALVLIGALIPPFLDTKRSRKTFAIAEKFFLFYTCGSGSMLVNAVVNLVNQSISDGSGGSGSLIALFSVFTLSNTISVILNSYMWKIKRKNVSEASAANLTEQEYWETVIKKQLESAPS